MAPIRILLVDDHPVFRYGMRALLAVTPDMDVVGEASSGEDALTLIDQVVPDVVLMDITMPGIDGISATAQLHATHPQIAVLIITMLEDDTVFAALRAGARGYLLKGAAPEETLRAIRAVASGEAIFSPAIAERVIHAFDAPQRNGATTPFAALTERERAVLTLMAHGLTNSAIAERLVLSQKTVRNYITEIFSKLEVSSRAEAIIRARGAGLV